MKKITNEEIISVSEDWKSLGKIICNCNESIQSGDFSQPIKPYLDFDNKQNRIIAMPARVGGKVNIAGIKWIASFPENKNLGLSRVSSTTILNDVNTGNIEAIINSSHLSSVRTVTVTYLMVKKYLEFIENKNVTAAIIGYGPIGQLHGQMLIEMFGEEITKIFVHDKRNEVAQNIKNDKLEFEKDLNYLIENMDILITCTDVGRPYIKSVPKRDSLVCNISLRDFYNFDKEIKPLVIVDNWDEVCRKNTNIESLYNSGKLIKDETIEFSEALNIFPKLNGKKFYFFNPMGMASFDIAIAAFYVDKYFCEKKDESW